MSNTAANEPKTEVTFKRVMTGIFEVYLNGQKTEFEIVNGCAGLSGRNTANIYGLANRQKETVKWFGPLRTCKQAVELTLQRRAAGVL